MTTYIIVSSTKSPLGPNEVPAGGSVAASEGDVFILGPDADANVLFTSAGPNPVTFEVHLLEDNANTLNLVFDKDLAPVVRLADTVQAPRVGIDGQQAETMTLIAGNGATLGKFDGSGGNDSLTVGDDFTAMGDWNLLGGDDSLTAGDRADFTASKIKGGSNNDTITFGHDARMGEVDGESGGDQISFGDRLSGTKLIGGSGSDVLTVGSGVSLVNGIDGGSGTDELTTQTGGLSHQNIETVNVICFATGTRIATATGPVAVEALRPGVALLTRDHGAVPLRWIGATHLPEPVLDAASRLRPVRIAAGALGPGIPRRDLLVSPQHRLLVQSVIVERLFNTPEVLVPAVRLLPVPGVRRQGRCGGVTYVHLLLDRHEVIFAEGAACESLLLTERSLAGLSGPARAALLRLTGPRLLPQDPARPIVERRAPLAPLLRRHRKNAKPLQSPALLPLPRAAGAPLLRLVARGAGGGFTSPPAPPRG